MSAVFEWRDAIRRPPPGLELKATDRLVALVLSFYMDKDTLENARPGPARLAAETGLVARTVKSSLQSLVKAGWIVQTKQGGTRKGGTEKVASVYKGAWPAGTRIPAEPTATVVAVPPGPSDTSAERAPVQDIHGSTSEGDARVPVNEDPFTGAADAHHLVLDLEQDLVCVAFSKLNLPKSVDTLGQENELKVKVQALVAIHGEDAVRDELEDIPDASFPFAGDLDRDLKRRLPTHSKAWGTAKAAVERHSGYVPGHTPSASYPHRVDPVFELDEAGNAVRIR